MGKNIKQNPLKYLILPGIYIEYEPLNNTM